MVDSQLKDLEETQEQNLESFDNLYWEANNEIEIPQIDEEFFINPIPIIQPKKVFIRDVNSRRRRIFR